MDLKCFLDKHTLKANLTSIMLLHRDGLIELNYNVCDDILSVAWPDLADVPETQVAYSFEKLVETIKYYDISKLLIDAREAYACASNEDRRAITSHLATDLLATRIQKIAWLTAAGPQRASAFQQMANALQDKMFGLIDNRSFSDEPEALSWLKV